VLYGKDDSGMFLSRRRMFQLAGVASLGASAAACSRAGGSSSSQGGSGKIFNAGEPYDAPPKGNLNPFDGIIESIPNALNYLYDLIVLPGAMYFWKQQQYFYLLADESSALSSDGKTFTYKVRDGMNWSDGKPITAQDVYTTSLLGYVMLRPAYSYVDSFEMTDNKTVTYHLATPAPIAQYYLLRERIVADSQFGSFGKQAEPLVKAKKQSGDKKMVALNKSISAFKPKIVTASGPMSLDVDSVRSDQMTLSKNTKSYLADKMMFDKLRQAAGVR
jgi:peptide/nickel transport system substrate-binding protein